MLCVGVCEKKVFESLSIKVVVEDLGSLMSFCDITNLDI